MVHKRTKIIYNKNKPRFLESSLGTPHFFKKQSPRDVLWKMYSKKFRKIQRKTPVRESLLPESLAQVLSCEFCETSKNTFFYRTSLVAVSVFFSWILFGLLNACVVLM